MGCASSKVDDLPAVALCRDRCTFLDEAIHQRYALAAAHMAYINSLKGIGHSLHLFIQQDRDLATGGGAAASPPPSPPPKSHLAKHASPPSSPPHSDSGSHLHFHSDEEDEDDENHHALHDSSGHSSPLHMDHPPFEEGDHEIELPWMGMGMGMGRMQMNYMKKQPTPSIVYQQRPMNHETVYVGESSSSYPYPYPNPYPSSSYQPYPQPYDPYGAPPPTAYDGSYPPQHRPPPSAAKPPPPPPSPPRASPWDFLNFFDADGDEKYYPQTQYTPSRDSREVREEEGIPDLEDEDYQHEVVKEVHVDRKLVDTPPSASASAAANHQDHHQPAKAEATDSESDGGLEYDVHVVDKKVVDEDDRPMDRGGGGAGAAAFRGRPGSRSAFEVAKEIEVLFQRASDSGAEIAKMLEVGKLPYNRKHGAAYQASSKMLQVVTPSLSMVSSQPSTSASAAPDNLDIDVDLVTRSRNLSSTLQKLYLWEKKLYAEVKAEEKMRVVHDKKCSKLKRLDERGADFNKVDATRAMIRSLSTKIRMAIQVVDRISMTINKIRDEELWPQLKELIQGMMRMWKSMLECHHNQCEAIREARILGSVGSRKKGGDGHLLATKQLEQELINWTFQFSSWISAQKGYVRALNNWLMKCLLYEPEETPDGIVPFSPGRIGAPPIFVICNRWSQAMDRISEKEVVDSMHVFTMSVLQIWEQDKLEMHRQMAENKDLERKVRNIDRDDQKIQKQIQALERKIALPSGEGKGLSVSENILYQSDKSSSLQASLQRIFEAMERFTDESVRAYEELVSTD
ncbi:hypothetical protein PIB30_039547 [Stylosanthes scabra]|uniref:Uncharacterized protein n=1 Tax=Stylosanthes scabra TaxID=79078 RepID=A0ABU6TE03_9FABA|nr:hypothetical protein [Stylosanthes scabra]